MKGYEIAANITPSDIQLEWQKMEYYGIFYYGMNTFLGKDISDGYAVPETFYPENIDTDSWAEAAQKAQMSGMIITAKHYDGFCNWQTDTTDYSVKSSNWLDGNGDLIKLCAESARKNCIKFGIYYPLWDMHEKSFGTSEYNDFVLKQINELTANYGSLFEFILDDRCDTSFKYPIDYKSIYALIRKNQPECAITFRGPDARWLGNSKGVTRSNEWSVVPASYSFDEDGSIPSSVKTKKENIYETDIGSRKFIKKETEFRWSPCEVIIPMRPHYFYRKDDDYVAKTKDKLLDIYYRTVGNNSCFVLGLSPDKSGKLHETDTQILESTGHDLKIIFGYNLLNDGKVSASSTLSKLYKPENIIANDSTFWSPSADDKKPEIIIEFNKPEVFDKIILMENIKNGQVVEEFTIYTLSKGKWKKFASGEAIGYKKICATKPNETEKIKIVFEKYRKNIQISLIQIN